MFSPRLRPLKGRTVHVKWTRIYFVQSSTDECKDSNCPAHMSPVPKRHVEYTRNGHLAYRSILGSQAGHNLTIIMQYGKSNMYWETLSYQRVCIYTKFSEKGQQSNMCIATPANSGFLSTKARLNLSHENRISSFWRSEQRPLVNKGHFCYSPWLTIVDRFVYSSDGADWHMIIVYATHCFPKL